MRKSGNKERAMRVLTTLVLAAFTAVTAPIGARADAPAELRMCQDRNTPRDQKIEACSFVITNAPPAAARELARVYLIRGNVYLDQAVYDRALADFDAATKVDPIFHFPYNSRGLVFSRQKKIDQAITEFDAAIRLNPRDPIVFTNRGDAYRDEGHYDRALEDYDAAIAINPNWVNALFGRALTLQRKANSDFDAFVNEGHFEQLAIAGYDKVLQIDPRNSGALSNRGLLYHALRKYDLAIADFTQAIAINSANPVFLDNRALTYRMLRRYDLAIADYRSALAVTRDAKERKVTEELLAQLGAGV
jgi:tetratricopeptide (TPR) repeat protein